VETRDFRGRRGAQVNSTEFMWKHAECENLLVEDGNDGKSSTLTQPGLVEGSILKVSQSWNTVRRGHRKSGM
jgi:hypothetical protein